MTVKSMLRLVVILHESIWIKCIAFVLKEKKWTEAAEIR